MGIIDLQNDLIARQRGLIAQQDLLISSTKEGPGLAVGMLRQIGETLNRAGIPDGNVVQRVKWALGM